MKRYAVPLLFKSLFRVNYTTGLHANPQLPDVRAPTYREDLPRLTFLTPRSPPQKLMLRGPKPNVWEEITVDVVITCDIVVFAAVCWHAELHNMATQRSRQKHTRRILRLLRLAVRRAAQRYEQLPRA